MKRLTTLLLGLMLSLSAVNAQSSLVSSCKTDQMLPYLSLSNSFSPDGNWQKPNSNWFHTLELGCYNDKTWYGVFAETQKFDHDFSLGLRMYRKIAQLTPNSQLLSNVAVKMPLFDSLNLTLEPGVCVNMKIERGLYFQGGISTTMNKYTGLLAVFPINYSFGVNLFLREN